VAVGGSGGGDSATVDQQSAVGGGLVLYQAGSVGPLALNSKAYRKYSQQATAKDGSELSSDGSGPEDGGHGVAGMLFPLTIQHRRPDREGSGRVSWVSAVSPVSALTLIFHRDVERGGVSRQLLGCRLADHSAHVFEQHGHGLELTLRHSLTAGRQA